MFYDSFGSYMTCIALLSNWPVEADIISSISIKCRFLNHFKVHSMTSHKIHTVPALRFDYNSNLWVLDSLFTKSTLSMQFQSSNTKHARIDNSSVK